MGPALWRRRTPCCELAEPADARRRLTVRGSRSTSRRAGDPAFRRHCRIAVIDGARLAAGLRSFCRCRSGRGGGRATPPAAPRHHGLSSRGGSWGDRGHPCGASAATRAIPVRGGSGLVPGVPARQRLGACPGTRSHWKCSRHGLSRAGRRGSWGAAMAWSGARSCPPGRRCPKDVGLTPGPGPWSRSLGPIPHPRTRSPREVLKPRSGAPGARVAGGCWFGR